MKNRGLTHETFDVIREASSFFMEQVVPEDQPVVEDVVLRHAMLRVIGLLRVFQQNPRLQLGPILLADPGEIEFLMLHFFGSVLLL